MNKGYKGLYLKEMKRADELEETVVKLERKAKRLRLETFALLVSVGVLSLVVFFRG